MKNPCYDCSEMYYCDRICIAKEVHLEKEKEREAMNKYVCKVCKNVEYSSAKLNDLYNPNCQKCGGRMAKAKEEKEVIK